MIRLSRIQRFCLDDGPGIRTTVFLGGCNLRCPWCSNPETVYGAPDSFTRYTPEDLERELLRDEAFFGDGGGVTFSGGEPLLQTEELMPLWESLRQKGVNIAVETAGFVDSTTFIMALHRIDLVILDAKIILPADCASVLQGDLTVYRHNVECLINAGVRVWLRYPLIKPFTTSKGNVEAITETACKLNPERLELLKGHNLGADKWINFGLQPYKVPELSNQELSSLQQEFVNKGIHAVVRS